MEDYKVDLHQIRNELSIRAKNGLGFLMSAVIIWTIIAIIFLLPIDLYYKNIFMLCSTGLMFPLSIAISHIIKSEWKFTDNPLGSLGLILNVAQIIYLDRKSTRLNS